MKTDVNLKARKAKRSKAHPYSSYLKEIRPTWKKNPEFVKNMITDMVEKKANLLERPFLMEFIERFMGIHQEHISKIRPELFEEVKIWVTRQRIQYIVSVFLWLRKREYENKYWVNKEYHLAFLEYQIELTTRALRYNNGRSKFQKFKTELLKQLQNGDYPDSTKNEPFWTGKVLGQIQYIKFLKAEKKNLLQTETFTTVKVPIELKKNQETHEDYLHVQIPPDFFKTIQQEAIRKELKSFNFPQLPTSHEPKLYTRKETAEIMQVSLPTLDELTKRGTIICHRIGDTSMKRYKWNDIQSALVKIETEFRRRSGM